MLKSRDLFDSSLLTGLHDLYENQWPTLCDLTIICANEEKVLAHKLILAVHSEYFAALFKHNPETMTTTSLPQFDSGVVKVIIKSLILGTDVTELNDVGLYQIIRAADYFQMKDLVSVLTDMILAEMTTENIQDVFDLSQTICSPTLEEACNDFIKTNIQAIFATNRAFLQGFSKRRFEIIFSKPWTLFQDKFGRPCDKMETIENLLFILYETLTASGLERCLESGHRLKELPDILKCFKKEDLHYIFTQNNSSVPWQHYNRKRVLSQNLELVLRFCTMYEAEPKLKSHLESNSHEIYWLPPTVLPWGTLLPSNTRPFGTHLTNFFEHPRNVEKWSVEGLIRKINIKSRTLDGKHIIQGLQFFLENGETKSVGMDMDDLNQVDVLVVPHDQHIRDFIIRSDSYIDAIGFETNQGQTFGLIGGSGGSLTPANSLTASLHRQLDKSFYYYIDGIRGKTVDCRPFCNKVLTDYDDRFICDIQFKYVCIPHEEAFIGPKGLVASKSEWKNESETIFVDSNQVSFVDFIFNLFPENV